ncbi:FCD domain-containing protein [Streptomyces sp. SID89]|nr:FCD domain-containing protein [Streptomyces sp. SID89]
MSPKPGVRGAVSRGRQLSEEVMAHIRNLIFSGGVRRGDFLRLEPIAEELGVSTTPVREGMLALASEGLIELIPRRGFVVVGLTREDVQDLLWAQAAIAGELAARSARKITDRGVEHLVVIQERHDRAAREGEFAELDRLGHEFHRYVNVTAAAPRLAQLLGATLQHMPQRFVAPHVRVTLHQHLEILDALRRRDVRGVRSQMRRHCLAAGEAILAHMEHQGVFEGQDPTAAA